LKFSPFKVTIVPPELGPELGKNDVT